MRRLPLVPRNIAARIGLPKGLCARMGLGALTGLWLTGLWATAANAQLPACQPPANDEYLLLTVAPNTDTQAKVYAVLPASFKPIACLYLNETVLRMGGFATQEAADSWSTYIAQQAGTSTFVARPPAPGQPSTLPPLPITPLPTAPPTATRPPAVAIPGGSSPLPTMPATMPPIAPSTGGYNPQALGNGYAVLVNYYNRPETATLVKQTAQQSIGLVSYGQKPYLLATFTNNQSAANELLQRLTDQGLWAMVVDGRRVMLLKSGI